MRIRKSRDNVRGAVTFVPVLSALTNRQALQRSIGRAKHDLRLDRVTLHRSPGGSRVNTTPSTKEG